jgi:hypothetical protein
MGATIYYDLENNIPAVVSGSGRVITVYPGGSREMDKRIQDQLLRRVDSFDGKIPALRGAIKDLDAVWQSDPWPQQTSRQFRTAWSELEQIYAGAVDRQARELTDDEIADARVALKIHKSIVSEAATA